MNSGQVDGAAKAVEGWANDPANLNVEAAAYETVAVALGAADPAEAGEWLRSMPASR